MTEETLTITREQEEYMRRYLPNVAVSSKIAGFYSIFGDNTRIRILSALAVKKMCVGDLSYILNINQTTISHQLKLMKDAGIVKCERVGRLMIYDICNKFVTDVMLLAVDKIENDREMYKNELNAG